MAIRKVGVIGAGVMGAGIAAQISNARIPVVLLDRAGENGGPNLAKQAIGKLLKSKPAAFMSRRNARLITPGVLEQELELLADADWIIEAVSEDLALKHAIYQKIATIRKRGAMVSSNTSTIPLRALVKGLPRSFQRNFLITHFFNPPRYMRLLEVVSSEKTSIRGLEEVLHFADHVLGKGVVRCKDTPGFIANRIGGFWLQCALLEALELGLTVEEADAVCGRPMGFPKTGVFGLMDLIGLDLMPHILGSLCSLLPQEDALHAISDIPPLLSGLIERGYTGRKGKGGFYRLNVSAKGRHKEVLDLQGGEYRRPEKPRLESLAAAKSGLRALLEHPDRGGQYASRVLLRTLVYTASLASEIADDIATIDQAMRLGYNWRYGPFELLDRLGANWLIERLESEGIAIPPALKKSAEVGGFYKKKGAGHQYLDANGQYQKSTRASGIYTLSDAKLGAKPVAVNAGAKLWDIGDGVLCLEFCSKMNSLDPDILGMLVQTVADLPRSHQALVIHNEGPNFSVGANLGLLLFASNIAAWSEVEGLVKAGQDTYSALKYAPFPVVGAPAGMALGGGCELLLHCDAIQAHSETYMGLVETGVGLVPAWGGCKELLGRMSRDPRRPRGPMPPVQGAFEPIAEARVSTSAAEAREGGFLRPHDRISMNPERLLADAKALALSLVPKYKPPELFVFQLPGPSGRAALELAINSFHRRRLATEHDVRVASKLAWVLSGGEQEGPCTEAQLLALERSAFVELARHPDTTARVEYMLENGKPLRN